METASRHTDRTSQDPGCGTAWTALAGIMKGSTTTHARTQNQARKSHGRHARSLVADLDTTSTTDNHVANLATMWSSRGCRRDAARHEEGGDSALFARPWSWVATGTTCMASISSIVGKITPLDRARGEGRLSRSQRASDTPISVACSPTHSTHARVLAAGIPVACSCGLALTGPPKARAPWTRREARHASFWVTPGRRRRMLDFAGPGAAGASLP